MFQQGNLLTGDKARLNLETDTGFVEHPRYRFLQTGGYGEGDRMDLEWPGKLKLENANYTTCGPDSQDWIFQSGTLSHDRDAEVGVARDATFYFLGRPLAWTKLYRRLTAPAMWGKQPQLDENALLRLIRSFEVAGERRSTTRYLAEVIFHFNPAAVRAQLRQSNIAYTDTRSRPALVIPVIAGKPGLLRSLGVAWNDQVCGAYFPLYADERRMTRRRCWRAPTLDARLGVGPLVRANVGEVLSRAPRRGVQTCRWWRFPTGVWLCLRAAQSTFPAVPK
jgi:hypothetical protein